MMNPNLRMRRKKNWNGAPVEFVDSTQEDKLETTQGKRNRDKKTVEGGGNEEVKEATKEADKVATDTGMVDKDDD